MAYQDGTVSVIDKLVQKNAGAFKIVDAGAVDGGTGNRLNVNTLPALTGDATANEGTGATTVVKIQGKTFPSLGAGDDEKYPKYDHDTGAFIMTAVSAGGGDVYGPSSSTEDHITLFDDSTGKNLKDSGISIDIFNTLTPYTNQVNDLTFTDWSLNARTERVNKLTLTNSANIDVDTTFYETDSATIHAVATWGVYFVGFQMGGDAEYVKVWKINPATKVITKATLVQTGSMGACVVVGDYLYGVGGKGIVRVHLTDMTSTLLVDTTDFASLPGMCTDGTYLYIAAFTGSNLYKYALDGTYINTKTLSGQLHWCGYDSVNGQILVTAVTSPGTIFRVNASTWTLAQTSTLSANNNQPTDDNAIYGDYLWLGPESGTGTNVVKVLLTDTDDQTYIDVGHHSYCVYSDGAGYIYSSDSASSQVTKIDTSDNSFVTYQLYDDDNKSPNEFLINGDYIFNSRWGAVGVYVRKTYPTANTTPTFDLSNATTLFGNIDTGATGTLTVGGLSSLSNSMWNISEDSLAWYVEVDAQKLLRIDADAKDVYIKENMDGGTGVRIGSTDAPTNTLSVTGSMDVSGTYKIKGTSTGLNTIATANTSATSYTNTIPAKDGTFAMTSDIVSQVEDNITDGHTTIAPSGNAVFDALALKAPLTSPTFATSITGSFLTASQVLATDGSKNIVSLAVATYPSLTELSYVKGVTSAIQTQLNAKAPTASPTFSTKITGSFLTASEMLVTNASKEIVSAPVATYPSLTELSYVKGLSSAIQTQLNAKAPLISPSFTTPTLGVATATSINKVTITAPATSATLTIADGKTFTSSNTITLTATDGSTLAIGTGGTLGTAAYTASTAYAPALGVNDNYVTDAQLVVIGNTSGTNTGDNATNTQYSGLAASKADVGQTFYIGTTQVAINRASAALTLAGLTLTTPDIGTPSAGTLTNTTGLPLTGLVSDTTTALGLGSINLGHASDTTIARVSAGIVSVEGINVLTATGNAVNVDLGVHNLTVDTNTLFIDATNHRIGYGTTSPTVPIEYWRDAGAMVMNIRTYNNTSTSGSAAQMQRARGTIASPTKVISGDAIGKFSFFGAYDNGAGVGTFTTAQAGLFAFATEDFNDSSHLGTRFVFRTTVTGSGTVSDTVQVIDGKLLAGTTTNGTYFSRTGDQTFVGSAGFYPRVLNQASEPASGTGATQCDTGEAVIWTDSDDAKCYLCYNHGGTVKTVELT